MLLLMNISMTDPSIHGLEGRVLKWCLDARFNSWGRGRSFGRMHACMCTGSSNCLVRVQIIESTLSIYQYDSPNVKSIINHGWLTPNQVLEIVHISLKIRYTRLPIWLVFDFFNIYLLLKHTISFHVNLGILLFSELYHYDSHPFN